MGQKFQAISDRLSEQKTTSPQRQSYLERLANLMTRNHDPSVRFKSIKTGRCRSTGDGMVIELCSQVDDQEVTSMPRNVWTLIAHEGLLVHEIGHVLYTDFDAHEEIKDELGMQEMNAFHDIVFNPAEDAAIEEQLRQKFTCAKELDTYNANLFEAGKPTLHELPIPQAVKTAILEKGCYDTGVIEEHLSGQRDLVKDYNRDLFLELLDEVNELLADVMTEPDPRTRYDRMLEFWEVMQDMMAKNGEKPEDEWQRDPDAGHDAKPSDEGTQGDGRQADELGDMDEDEVQEQLEETGVPQQHDWDDILDEDDSEDADEDGESGASDEEAGDEAETDGEGAGDGDGDADSESDGDASESSGEGADGEDDAEDSDAEGSAQEAETDGDDGAGGDGDAGDDADAGESGGDSAGRGEGGDDEGSRFPGHEGHTLVITD